MVSVQVSNTMPKDVTVLMELSESGYRIFLTTPLQKEHCANFKQLLDYNQISILGIWNFHVEPVSLTLAKLACAFWHILATRHKDHCHIHPS